MSKKLFDFCIGNPPFQEQSSNTSDKPIYNLFMDACYNVANKTELIHPARFLFDAGKTPKDWNQKMLNDSHFKVLKYVQNSTEVFENTDIKGGVATTYRDDAKVFEPIKIFTTFEELNSILNKVKSQVDLFLDKLVYAPESYKFTEQLYIEHPEIKKMKKLNKKGEEVPLISDGHAFDLVTNIFESLENIAFFEAKPNDGEKYVQIIGRLKNERKVMWVKRTYIADHPNLEKWKVILPKSNGSGAIGEVLSTPLIGEPLIGHNQTFISIGAFETKVEAEACMKYVKTKFARTMLGILKITQHNPASTWRYVPLQDFTSASDIDWSKSVHEIDEQLYQKYELSENEVDFIETNVKEME